jgi:hypothetical protein
VRRRPSSSALAPLALAVALLGCSGGEAPEAPEQVDTGTDAEAAPSTPEATETSPSPTPRECRHDTLPEEPIVELVADDPVALGAELAGTTHRCADLVVVAEEGGWAGALAVAVAVAEDAPLLLAGPAGSDRVHDTLTALAPSQLLTVGLPDLPVPDGVEVVPLGGDDASDAGDADTTEAGAAGEAEGSDDADLELALALAVLEHLGADRAFAVPYDDRTARAAALGRDGGAVPLLPIRTDREDLGTLSSALPPALRIEVVSQDETVGTTLADRLVGVGVDAQVADADWWELPATTETVWLVDPAQTSATAVTAATAATRSEGLLPVHADDLRLGRDRVRRIAEASPSRAVVVGDVTEHAGWQLRTVLDGPRLPWGGLTLFADERIVALYGTPTSTRLGALGEQDLEATVARAREVAEPYGADGRRVVPAFEIIVTIASAEAGDQGDYSRRLDPGSFRPWIDRAAEEGFYVVLDLQPGRTDFLSQAKEYEELLREPHVGLALDPEWRLEDDQVHLRQIGSVSAAEVQEVVDWLAALVREHRLPQKLLVLHQFRFSMLPDRDDIVTPPELAVVVHMDGQGPIGDKYDTYAAITAGAEDRWWWGWKNFYDEDRPTPTPAQVLELDPLPVFVTYQ